LLNDENDENLGKKILNKRRKMGTRRGDMENWPNLRVVTKQTYLSGNFKCLRCSRGKEKPLRPCNIPL
jgi:hypothetical protein